MDPTSAIVVVSASYLASMLAWRRVRVARARRDGIELSLFLAYDHRAVARALAREVDPAPVGAAGPTRPPVAPAAGTLALGELPEPWRSAPWASATPEILGETRDALLAGDVPGALGRAAGAPLPAVRSLLAWAALDRLFAGDLGQALEIARALGTDSLALRLEAAVLAREVEVTAPGPFRRRAIRAAIGALRRAGAREPDAAPALAGLLVHLEVLDLSLLALEPAAWAASRALDRAQRRAPEEPVLHLVRAHLAAVLGEPDRAAAHLARAFYFARGEPFYARAVLASRWLATERPALVAGARAALDAGERPSSD